MKIALNIVDAKFDAASRDEFESQISLALKETQGMFHNLQYWGRHGEKRKKVSDLSQAIKTLKKPGICVLSDADEGEGSTELRLSVRKELISLHLFRDIDTADPSGECAALSQCFKMLYGVLKSVQFPLVSSICLPETDFAKPRPPKRWRVFDPWGIVDFIKPSQIDFPDARKITESLANGALPKGVIRRKIDGDMVAVDWTDMDTAESGMDKVLSGRSVWYRENGEFENDTDFNDTGDMRVDIFENRKTGELTFYDALTQSGYKAIGFEANSNSYEEDKVRKLQRMLKSGKTPEGLPLSKAYVVVSKREFALFLKPVADEHNLSGVLYADDAGQLWNPFPEGLWLD